MSWHNEQIPLQCWESTLSLCVFIFHSGENFLFAMCSSSFWDRENSTPIKLYLWASRVSQSLALSKESTIGDTAVSPRFVVDRVCW